MRKIGWLLFLIGMEIMIFNSIHIKILENKAKGSVDDYIEKTSSIVEPVEEIINRKDKMESSKKKKNNIDYTAILEIPVIHLKRGVINSTKNFSSINYEVSVDVNSTYPNENGNFILYAHSGNSNVAYFRNLNMINENDDIYVYFNGVKYHYVVIAKYDIVKTGNARVINLKDNKYITLITCDRNKDGYQIVVEGVLLEEKEY